MQVNAPHPAEVLGGVGVRVLEDVKVHVNVGVHVPVQVRVRVRLKVGVGEFV